MSGPEWLNLIAAPIGLGLFGFFEPCSIGSTLVFLKLMEGRSVPAKAAQVLVFTLVRGITMGLLGLAAAMIGSVFFGFQRAVWFVFGLAYVSLGVLYVARRADFLMLSLGPRLARVKSVRAAWLAALLFALNIPACAAPLLLALLGSAAAGGAAGGSLASGFFSLALFGIALSLPLAAAVLIPRAPAGLDWLAAWGRRAPTWTGVVLIALGLWSVWFGLFVTPDRVCSISGDGPDHLQGSLPHARAASR